MVITPTAKWTMQYLRIMKVSLDLAEFTAVCLQTDEQMQELTKMMAMNHQSLMSMTLEQREKAITNYTLKIVENHRSAEL